jgi:hypothetical protein
MSTITNNQFYISDVFMKKILSSLCFITTTNIFAAGITSNVSFIQVNAGTSWPDLVAIKFTSMPSNSPSCATDSLGRFATTLTTEAGKAIYSMALAAQASGKTLEVFGKGTCIAGSLEEIDYIRIKN